MSFKVSSFRLLAASTMIVCACATIADNTAAKSFDSIVESIKKFVNSNILMILLILLYIIKLYFNVAQPIQEVEGSLVQTIKSQDDWNGKIEKALTEDNLIVCDFFAHWCPPCKKCSPVYSKLSIEYQGKPIVFWKVDVDAVSTVASSQNVSSMPLFRIYTKGVGKNGEAALVELESMVGWLGEDKFRALIDKQLMNHRNKEPKKER